MRFLEYRLVLASPMKVRGVIRLVYINERSRNSFRVLP